jgi:hypothetical protein
MTKAEQEQYDAFYEETVDPETGQGDQELAFDLWTRWKILTDLYFFGAEALNWQAAGGPGGRKRVDKKFHKWLARRLEKEGDKLIMCARWHCKSYWVKLRIAQRILQNPNIRIALISSTTGLVVKELGHIKRILAHPVVRRLFGPDFSNQVPEPGKDYKNWEKSTQTELTVKRDPSLGDVPQEPQVMALGVGSEITGLHVDEIYADDVVTRFTVTTAEQMRKTEEWWAYAQFVVEVVGDICITGTFYHMNDLYNKVIKEGHFPKKSVFIRPAHDPSGEIVYKAWFRESDFRKLRKRMSAYEYSCQIDLNPIPPEDHIFPPPQPTYITLPSQEYAYYIAVDPAATTESYSDDTGVVIAAVDNIGNIYIVEAWNFKKKGDELARFLVNKCMQYKPTRVGIELGLQTHLQFTIDTIKAEYERKHNILGVPGLPAEPIPVSKSYSKGQRVNLSLGAFIRTGKFKINERLTNLIMQMDHFTGRGKETS